MTELSRILEVAEHRTMEFCPSKQKELRDSGTFSQNPSNVIVREGLREGSRWQSRRMWSSPFLTNTSKIHLHVEHCSQKTSWKLAEDLYDQSCKTDLHVTG